MKRKRLIYLSYLYEGNQTSEKNCDCYVDEERRRLLVFCLSMDEEKMTKIYFLFQSLMLHLQEVPSSNITFLFSPTSLTIWFTFLIYPMFCLHIFGIESSQFAPLNLLSSLQNESLSYKKSLLNTIQKKTISFYLGEYTQGIIFFSMKGKSSFLQNKYLFPSVTFKKKNSYRLTSITFNIWFQCVSMT
jgi:hypothetical protein